MISTTKIPGSISENIKKLFKLKKCVPLQLLFKNCYSNFIPYYNTSQMPFIAFTIFNTTTFTFLPSLEDQISRKRNADLMSYLELSFMFKWQFNCIIKTPPTIFVIRSPESPNSQCNCSQIYNAIPALTIIVIFWPICILFN